MAKAVGFNRFMLFKSQPAWGTKATGLTQTMVPLRGGGLLEPNPLLQPREDAIFAISPFAQYYEAPKFVPWSASVLFVNPTTAATTLRDFLRTVYGLETLVVGPPITKTYTINDPPIDGATDTGTLLYGRGLTIHEQCDDSAGVKIYADEVQDGIVNELSMTWRNDAPLMVAMRGMASDFQHNQTDLSPTIPAGSLFTYRHLRDQTNAGLRIGTANPPTSANKCIFSQAVLTISNPLRYMNFMGAGTTQEAVLPTRDDQVGITLDVTMDVETAVASQSTADDIAAWFVNRTPVNCNFLTYVDANNILQFQTTGATAGCFIETVRRAAPNLGAMQYTVRLRVAPSALGDTILKLTTAS